jgi:predicted acyltransferase
MAKLLGIIKVGEIDGKTISLQQWIFNNIFLSIAAPINASLMYAVSFILVWLLLMWILYRKGIFLKI